MKYFWDLILYLVGPLVYLQSKIAWPFKIKRLINSEHYYLLKDKLRDGDGFMTFTAGEFSNLLNPSGEFKHIFVVVDAANELMMEVIGTGSRYFKFAEIIHHYDRIAHVRPSFLTARELGETLKASEIFSGLPYDLIFDNNDWIWHKKNKKRAVYCWELYISLLMSLTEREIYFQEKEMIKGKKVYCEQTIRDTNLFKILYDSKEKAGL